MIGTAGKEQVKNYGFNTWHPPYDSSTTTTTDEEEEEEEEDKEEEEEEEEDNGRQWGIVSYLSEKE